MIFLLNSKICGSRKEISVLFKSLKKSLTVKVFNRRCANLTLWPNAVYNLYNTIIYLFQSSQFEGKG